MGMTRKYPKAGDYVRIIGRGETPETCGFSKEMQNMIGTTQCVEEDFGEDVFFIGKCYWHISSLKIVRKP